MAVNRPVAMSNHVHQGVIASSSKVHTAIRRIFNFSAGFKPAHVRFCAIVSSVDLRDQQDMVTLLL